MILVCPLCQTRYLVQANLFAHGPRAVRCVRCRHNWKAELAKEIDVVAPPAPETVPPPASLDPIPAGSNLPVIRRHKLSPILQYSMEITAGALLAFFLMWFIFNRQHIVHQWAFLEPVYNAVGLYIYYPGDGLEFDQVRSELKYDGGITRLFLDGKIKNKTKKNQKVPDIVAQALGPDGLPIQSWQIDAPTATLAPGAETAFSSSINAPKGTVVNVNLNFVELKDDN